MSLCRFASDNPCFPWYTRGRKTGSQKTVSHGRCHFTDRSTDSCYNAVLVSCCDWCREDDYDAALIDCYLPSTFLLKFSFSVLKIYQENAIYFLSFPLFRAKFPQNNTTLLPLIILLANKSLHSRPPLSSCQSIRMVGRLSYKVKNGVFALIYVRTRLGPRLKLNLEWLLRCCYDAGKYPLPGKKPW